MSEVVQVDRHLYLTADGSRVVEENDPAGASLWATPGHAVSRKDAERLGALELLARPKGSSLVKLGPVPANKQASPPANKAR